MIYIKTIGRASRLAHRLAGALSMLLAMAQPISAQEVAQDRLPTVKLVAGMHLVQAEVASTPTQQMMGMMHRKEMGANEGMLFVNPHPERRCFWMRNTLIPLTIAFIADDGSIVNLADMQPLSEQSHCSARPVRFALEMRQGWFAKRGLGPGFKLRGDPFQP